MPATGLWRVANRNADSCYCPAGSRKIASCGFSTDENAPPPAFANRMETVALDAGVSSRQKLIAPGLIDQTVVSVLIGNTCSGIARGTLVDGPAVA